METFETVRKQVAETVMAIAETEVSAISTLLKLGDSLLGLRGAISAAVANELEFVRTGGINDNKAALRNLRQLLWQLRMLADFAISVRSVATGIAENCAAADEAGTAAQQ